MGENERTCLVPVNSRPLYHLATLDRDALERAALNFAPPGRGGKWNWLRELPRLGGKRPKICAIR